MSEFCNFDDTSHFVGPSSKLLHSQCSPYFSSSQLFFVTSRAPTSFASSRAHLEITASQCSPYFSSSQLFAKSVTPFAITVADTIMSKLLLCCIGYTFCNNCCRHNYEQAPIVLQKSIADRLSIFFANNCELTCVCSFFFVTLRREIVELIIISNPSI